ncbi:MAG: S9 family peptidase [Candidatus Eremiobacteraeota bacterium]|nr:S9 family peptidase [Candidatus Eremiobacteraeota bacterium]
MIASLLFAAVALAPAGPSAAPAPAPAAPATAAPAAPKPLTLEALRQTVSVREPAISPDGKRIAYVRGVGDFKADVEKTELILVDVASGARRVLTQDRSDVSNPAWSPDGTRIAFLAAPAKDEMPEIYVLSLDGGDAQRITHVRGTIGGFAWRPDGRAFAFTLRDPQSGAGPAPSPSPGAAKPSPSPTPKGYVEAFTVTDEHYLTRAPSRPSHLWTIDADGANPHQITHGAASDSGRIDWLPGAKQIVLTEQPDAIFAHLTKQHAVVVDLARGTTRPLRAGTVDGGAVLSPDGARAAVRVPRHANVYLQNDLAVRRVSDGADVSNTVALDRNVRWWDWLDDRTVLVGAADGVRQYLWRIPADGGAAARYDLGEVDFGNDATVARDGTIAFVGHLPDGAGELYVLRRNAKPVALSDENGWLRGYALGRSQRIDWTSDGMNVDGVLTYPPNYTAGKQYPLVLVIHGGPVGTSTRAFNGLAQLLASHGDLVLQPNYRGSDNSGDAFLQAIVGPVTSGPGRDNLAGVEAVKKMGIVDPARIGVSGWSGGGLQTSWLIGHATFWRAALSGAAVDDWFEQATLADINEEFAATFLGGATPWTADGRAKYRDESPITYAKNVKTPTLILTDSSDQRVPISQSFAFYRALQGNGVDVRMIEFPRVGHNPTDPVGREARVRIWTEWFDKWLK